MSPTTRKVARLIGELGSIERRLKNILPEIKNIEFESQALQNSKQAEDKQPAKASHGERLWALGEPEPDAGQYLKELNDRTPNYRRTPTSIDWIVTNPQKSKRTQ